MTTSASKCTSRSTTPGNASARQLAQSVALAIPPVTLSATNSASTCGICGHGGSKDDTGTVRPAELTTAKAMGGGGGPGDSDVKAPAAMAVAIDTPKSVSRTQAAAANFVDLLSFHGMRC